MKKTILVLLSMIFGVIAFAQISSSDINNPNKQLTWLGLDFSMFHFIGQASQFGGAGEVTNTDLVNKYFPGWNSLIQDEQDKFAIAKNTKRSEVNYKIDVANKANTNLAKKDFFTNDLEKFNRLTEADIKKAVSSYNFQGNKGLGLMFFVEAFNKAGSNASIWMTFIDMDKKSVVYTERVTEKATGIGFRNYWAGSINNAIKSLKKIK